MQQLWRTSSYSQDRGNCVEVVNGHTHEQYHLRDTQHRDLGHLSFPPAEWRALLGSVRRGEV